MSWRAGRTSHYNPASNVKIATAYAVLKTFGPDYRFPTNVWTDGSYDRSRPARSTAISISRAATRCLVTSTPSQLASELNRMGIEVGRRRPGRDGQFRDELFDARAPRSSQALFATLDASKRSCRATRVWSSYLINSGKLNTDSRDDPSVSFTGSVYVQPMPSNVKLLFTHESAPIREIVKATLCYSNNFLAERLGECSAALTLSRESSSRTLAFSLRNFPSRPRAALASTV